VVNLSTLVNVIAGRRPGERSTHALHGVVATVAAQAAERRSVCWAPIFTGATAVAFTKVGGGTVNGTGCRRSDTTITVKARNLRDDWNAGDDAMARERPCQGHADC
jgi:hypothetical protein